MFKALVELADRFRDKLRVLVEIALEHALDRMALNVAERERNKCQDECRKQRARSGGQKVAQDLHAELRDVAPILVPPVIPARP